LSSDIEHGYGGSRMHEITVTVVDLDECS
jgi:hypothetical protein